MTDITLYTLDKVKNEETAYPAELYISLEKIPNLGMFVDCDNYFWKAWDMEALVPVHSVDRMLWDIARADFTQRSRNELSDY